MLFLCICSMVICGICSAIYAVIYLLKEITMSDRMYRLWTMRFLVSLMMDIIVFLLAYKRIADTGGVILTSALAIIFLVILLADKDRKMRKEQQ